MTPISGKTIAAVGSGVMARLIYTIFRVTVDGRSMSAQAAFHHLVFEGWLPPRLASLCFALTFVLFWYAILLVLYRRKIYIRV